MQPQKSAIHKKNTHPIDGSFFNDHACSWAALQHSPASAGFGHGHHPRSLVTCFERHAGLDVDGFDANGAAGDLDRRSSAVGQEPGRSAARCKHLGCLRRYQRRNSALLFQKRHRSSTVAIHQTPEAAPCGRFVTFSEAEGCSSGRRDRLRRSGEFQPRLPKLFGPSPRKDRQGTSWFRGKRLLIN